MIRLTTLGASVCIVAMCMQRLWPMTFRPSELSPVTHNCFCFLPSCALCSSSCPVPFHLSGCWGYWLTGNSVPVAVSGCCCCCCRGEIAGRCAARPYPQSPVPCDNLGASLPVQTLHTFYYNSPLKSCQSLGPVCMKFLVNWMKVKKFWPWLFAVSQFMTLVICSVFLQ